MRLFFSTYVVRNKTQWIIDYFNMAAGDHNHVNDVVPTVVMWCVVVWCRGALKRKPHDSGCI